MLINIDEIEREKELYKFKSHADKCNRFINEDVKLEIDVQMGKLSMGESIHFATDARWHLHDVIVWILTQTGPADLYFCTYAIKEYQARLFSKMKADGIIKDVFALVDYRASVHDANVIQLLEGYASKIGSMRTHAKLTVIKNENWGVTITGSANLTQNTRSDVGVITSNMEVANYRIDWILNNIK